MTISLAEPDSSLAPIRVFFSFAHQDDAYRIQLEKHLSLLRRQRLIAPWSFRKILGGEDFAEVIDDQLARADLVLLLVSADFLASDYCFEIEMQTALRRHEAGKARVVPVLIRDCDWQSAPFAHLQGLPTGFRPVGSWPEQDEAWADVARGLRKVVVERQGIEAARPAPATGDEAPDPTRYLEALDAEHAYVEIRGMGAKVAERLPLEQVYTRLRVAHGATPDATPDVTPGGREKRDRKRGRADLLGAGSMMEGEFELRDVIRAERVSVLIGDPGSGKTTFLRFATRMLARARLLDDPGLAAEHLGLDPDQAVPLPIFVRLSELAAFLVAKPRDDVADDVPAHFDRYLDFLQRGHGYRLPATYLRDEVAAGRAFVLLDGLDEVPGDLRQRVARIVEKAMITGRRAGNRYLITCRIRAYTGRAQLAGLLSYRLAPFRAEQVAAFVRGWCRALYQGRGDAGAAAAQAEVYRAELWEAIRSHPSVGPLTENPLMLTVLAVVHWNDRKLPEERVLLYRAALGWLLDSRSAASDLPTLLRQEALQVLALRMFTDSEGVQRRLGRAEAAAAVAPVLLGEAIDPADFLDQEALWSGVLVSRSAGEVEFWHLSFQEYLAALELRRDRDYWSTLEPCLHHDRWSEVTTLLGGCLRIDDGSRAVRAYIEQILTTGVSNLAARARAVGLIGRILRDIAPSRGDCSAGTGYAAALRDVLAIFEPGGEAVAETVRVEVGEALGQAGDPRLVNELEDRVALPACSFWMGAQSHDKKGRGFDSAAHADEKPVHRVHLSPFTISRYPVTVRNYATFVAEGGYGDAELWAPSGWAWIENESITEPDGWTAQLRFPNRPVTRVSWFEADAFCRWARGTLPSEAQWEYAARGDQGRPFPWGDAAPSAQHAAFAGRLRHASPVGVYPLGASPEGVHDLAGNVREWCGDWFGDYDDGEQSDPAGLAEGTWRVVRGGSFVNVTRYLRGAFRRNGAPRIRAGFAGFRVVWRVPGGLS